MVSTRSSASKRKRVLVVESSESDGGGLAGESDVESNAESDLQQLQAKSPSTGIGEPETSGDEQMDSAPTTKRRKTRSSFLRRDEVFIHDGDGEDQYERDEEDREESESPVVRRKSNVRLRRKREMKEVDEDLEDLMDGEESSDEDRIRNSSTQTPRKLSTAMAIQELKKRRRAVGDRSDFADPPSEIADLESVGEDDYYAGIYEPPTSAREMFHEDEDDAEFIDKEDDTLGAPVELPAEFSALSSAKPKHLFRHVVEWSVLKRVYPPLKISDQDRYRISISRTADEAQGLSGSKFTSSAWSREFLKSLQERPYMERKNRIGAYTDLHCMACGRNHPAKFTVSFHGEPYNRRTLTLRSEEEAEQDAEDDDEEDDDEEEEEKEALCEPKNSTPTPALDDDADANPTPSTSPDIPPSTAEYHIGSHCMHNATIAHFLHHWHMRLHLNVLEALKAHPDIEEAEDPDVEVDDKHRFAEQLVEEWMQDGTVSGFYREFRDEMETARLSKTNWSAEKYVLTT
ncbi:hypothetical protein K402DRAFT_460738 [Aulographum hederae CBS 113979]|uniref:DUF4211 domain-containing protein n=1 Tax=Aulographum hederae CBS 113979 TaxID=1176131 RepID=A0A6G1HAB4_9PEZI|nr:hypothetical protein K402DRAFT_460738 [Aulographum hederae CBS 113979]